MPLETSREIKFRFKAMTSRMPTEKITEERYRWSALLDRMVPKTMQPEARALLITVSSGSLLYLVHWSSFVLSQRWERRVMGIASLLAITE